MGASAVESVIQSPAPMCCPQCPTDGYFTFELEPYGTVIGEAGILVDTAQGVGTSTIVKDPKEDGIYGIPPPGQYQGARSLQARRHAPNHHPAPCPETGRGCARSHRACTGMHACRAPACRVSIPAFHRNHGACITMHP